MNCLSSNMILNTLKNILLTKEIKPKLTTLISTNTNQTSFYVEIKKKTKKKIANLFYK